MADIVPDRTDKFADLVTRHQGRLYGYVYALVQNSADAEDLVQRTVLILWQRFDKYESGTSFSSWAMATAKYEVLNFLKTQRRRAFHSDKLLDSLVDYAASIDDDDLEAARKQALIECVDELREADQDLVRRRYEREQALEDVAAQVDRSSQSVSNSMKRIRANLYRCIQQRLRQEGLL